MANENRGEVSAVIDGKTLTFRLATNEWCELEDEHGKTTGAIIDDLSAMMMSGKLDMRFIRSLFKAALSGQKPDISDKEAGDLMNRLGLVETGSLIGRVVRASLPDDDDAGEEDGKKPDPRPAKGGKARTGKAT